MPKTKAELIEQIATRTTLPVRRADGVVRLIFDCMKEALVQGDGVEVRGFGSFSIRSYAGYVGRNPRSGESIEVKPKRLPYFKVGKELHGRINGSRRDP